MNFTHTGLGTWTSCPVGLGIPVFSSMANTTTLLEFWFAAIRNLPVGSMPKLRGTLPPVDWWPAAVRWPVASSTLNTATESWPRLETYTHLPLGWTWHSAVEFPFTGSASVLRDWTTLRTPLSGSYVITWTVEVISPQT